MTESERSGQRAGGGFLKRLAINIRKESCTVIAFTGGGGKTDLIFRLTDELTAAGKKVIVTTTTHMAAEPGHPAAEHGIAAQGDKQAYCEREYRTFGGEAGQQLHRERPGRAAYFAALDGAAHGEGCKHTGG